MLKTETCPIDGVTYAVTQLPTMRAMRLFARIAKTVGPALGKLKANGTEGVTEDSAGAFLETLFERLGPDDFEHALMELFWSLRRNNVDMAPKAGGSAFDVEMTGQLTTILKLLRFAFEVNYGNFTGAAGQLLAAAGKL